MLSLRKDASVQTDISSVEIEYMERWEEPDVLGDIENLVHTLSEQLCHIRAKIRPPTIRRACDGCSFDFMISILLEKLLQEPLRQSYQESNIELLRGLGSRRFFATAPLLQLKKEVGTIDGEEAHKEYFCRVLVHLLNTVTKIEQGKEFLLNSICGTKKESKNLVDFYQEINIWKWKWDDVSVQREIKNQMRPKSQTTGNFFPLSFSIESLWLNTLRLRKEDVDKLQHVTSFFACRNHLMDLPQELTQLHNISTLKVENNELCAIPSCILVLHSLQTLSLRNNSITSLVDLRSMKKLSSIDLSGNQISSWSADWQLPVTLSSLNLSCNQLHDFPFTLPLSLSSLHLENNVLETVVIEKVAYAKLSVLLLGRNQLKKVRILAEATPQLQELTLNHNKLQSQAISLPLPALAVLHLEYNDLLTVPEDLKTCSSLQILYIFPGNHIAVVPSWLKEREELEMC